MFNIKDLLSGVFRGFVQIGLLIIMTVLFGSTYNAIILLVALFLSCFITLTVISRTYSIYFYCAWLERAVDGIQTEYATPNELNAIRTILSGMPSFLTHNTTLGSKNAAGIPLEQHDGQNNPVLSPPRRKPTTAIINTLPAAC